MTKNWEDVRPEIKRLYLTQGKPLEEVRKVIKDRHGFDASLRAYKNKFDEWGWKKYKKLSCLSGQRVTQSRSQHEVSASSAVLVTSDRTRLERLEESLKHQTALVRKEKDSLLSLCESASRDRSEETSIEQIAQCNENIARVERSIRSLKSILSSAIMQISQPTGFASCWKQQPMILEDAHGTFIPIPLDVVVSWQVFDNVLQSHFRTLPGTKKVAKREYAIEDSATCTNFSRDCTWTSLCKAGLKIDMSMIFSDRSKTSVVCPKCNTISSERKGVMVECKNPGCKMFFRTEEEDDRPATASRVRRSRSRSPMSTAPPHILSPIPCQDEQEDQPGLFKRVIMRIAKAILMVADQNERRRLDEDFVDISPQQGSHPDLFSSSFGGSLDQISPHPSFTLGIHAQVWDTIAIPWGENQQVREGNPLTGEPLHVGDTSLKFDAFGISQYVPRCDSDKASLPAKPAREHNQAVFEFGIEMESSIVSFQQEQHVAMSEHDSPVFDSTNLDQLNSQSPPIELSSLENFSSASSFPLGYNSLPTVSDTDHQILSSMLSPGSVDWSHYDSLHFHSNISAPSNFGQAASFAGFDSNSINQPELTTEVRSIGQPDRSDLSTAIFEKHYPSSLNSPKRPSNSERSGSTEDFGGMSWGGVSVRSWIRDDIIMADSSPRFDRSSHPRKSEDGSVRDFACCGKTLPTLDDLVEHYEESHPNQAPQLLSEVGRNAHMRGVKAPNNEFPYTHKTKRDMKKKKGCRTGVLSTEVKQRARQIRKIGACLRCSTLRLPCSPETVCSSCQRSGFSANSSYVCIRSHLYDVKNHLSARMIGN